MRSTALDLPEPLLFHVKVSRHRHGIEPVLLPPAMLADAVAQAARCILFDVWSGLGRERAERDVQPMLKTWAGEVLERMQAHHHADTVAVARKDSAAAAAALAGPVPCGRCSLDLDARRLFEASGQEIAITAMEYDLLRVFLANPNRVLSRDQLLLQTRNREWEPFDRSIDIRIGRLRKKIEPDPAAEPRCIRTVRNAGYMFVPA